MQFTRQGNGVPYLFIKSLLQHDHRLLSSLLLYNPLLSSPLLFSPLVYNPLLSINRTAAAVFSKLVSHVNNIVGATATGSGAKGV